jgi:hypothetical protein
MDVQWKNVYVCIAEENVQLKNVYAYTCNVQKWYMYVQRKKIFRQQKTVHLRIAGQCLEDCIQSSKHCVVCTYSVHTAIMYRG